MLFNSLVFVIFLPIVFGGYWLLRKSTFGQNLFVVIASYVFYGWWDWKFLILISFTSLWAWGSGLVLESIRMHSGVRSKTREKWVVAGALIVNLGILAVFKYYNFFLDNAVLLLGQLGFQAHPTSLQIILPVGISFYTFQALSYVIDVYRRDIRPTRDVVSFLAFVSFFPQLVAGPIERATNLLPQLLKPRQFDYALATEGCRQMLWGFFKKVLVADSCAYAANKILIYSEPTSIALWMCMFCFAFQIYGDFSGYSDIAIGCSKLFGIRLMKNFDKPYFSRDIAEFWRRWHISLTTWFRDYLYIPLGGSRCGKLKKIRNTFAIFLVSGFWHGANWTFIFWGLFHACCFLPLLLTGKNRKFTTDHVAAGRILPHWGEIGQVSLTFLAVLVGWTFFRAPDIGTAFHWLWKMFTFADATIHGCNLSGMKNAILFVTTLLVLEWFNRGRAVPLLPKRRMLRWAIYYLLVTVLLVWDVEPQTFIYFQF